MGRSAQKEKGEVTAEMTQDIFLCFGILLFSYIRVQWGEQNVFGSDLKALLFVSGFAGNTY